MNQKFLNFNDFFIADDVTDDVIFGPISLNISWNIDFQIYVIYMLAIFGQKQLFCPIFAFFEA